MLSDFQIYAFATIVTSATATNATSHTASHSHKPSAPLNAARPHPFIHHTSRSSSQGHNSLLRLLSMSAAPHHVAASLTLTSTSTPKQIYALLTSLTQLRRQANASKQHSQHRVPPRGRRRLMTVSSSTRHASSCTRRCGHSRSETRRRRRKKDCMRRCPPPSKHIVRRRSTKAVMTGTAHSSPTSLLQHRLLQQGPHHPQRR